MDTSKNASFQCAEETVPHWPISYEKHHSQNRRCGAVEEAFVSRHLPSRQPLQRSLSCTPLRALCIERQAIRAKANVGLCVLSVKTKEAFMTDVGASQSLTVD